MLKALLKKQFLELGSFYVKNRKTGKKRTGASLIFFILLFVVLFASLGFAFGSLGIFLAKPLHDAGLSWLYFTLTGTLAIALGVFGSVFNTYASLYKSKDNDLLLSMPIPPSKIIFVRLVGVYTVGFFYEALMMIPTTAVYFYKNGVDVLSLICSCLLILIIGLFILVLTCILGWLVAVISTKIKNKSFVTVLSSLLFLALYYFVYFKITSFIQNFVQVSEEIGNGVQKYAYPLYMLGNAFLGNIPYFLIITTAVFALAYIAYAVLSKSFLKITTSNQTAQVKKAKKENTVQSGVSHALFVKELKRFAACPTYILNCALGTVLMPVTAIAFIIKKDFLMGYIEALSAEFPFIKDILPLIICAVVCILASMNDLTAPSVSLEGKSIWIVQSMPIDSRYVLSSKIKLHLVMTLSPAFICCVALFAITGTDLVFSLIGTVLVVLFICFMASAGLVLNLKMPNLSWQNEAVPIKQSMAVLIALFGGWITVMLMAGGFFLLRNTVTPIDFAEICIIVLAVLTALTNRWINTKGAKIFEKLS